MKRRADKRSRDLARIHMLKAQLGLDDDNYRNVLWTVGRVRSAADLDEFGRNQVIQHLSAHLDQRRASGKYPGTPHNFEAKERQELKKIGALLADAGKPWAYAGGMARHMYGIDRLEFCGSQQLAGIIAALETQAIKRLQAELRQVFGQGWDAAAAWIAMIGFGFDCFNRDITRSTQAMSQALRWQRGELAPVCAWPAERSNQQHICLGCALRSGLP